MSLAVSHYFWDYSSFCISHQKSEGLQKGNHSAVRPVVIPCLCKSLPSTSL